LHVHGKGIESSANLEDCILVLDLHASHVPPQSTSDDHWPSDEKRSYLVLLPHMSHSLATASVGIFRRVSELVAEVDRERADNIIKASLAAAIPMQEGARAQAELAAGRLRDIFARVTMLTAYEVGKQAGSDSNKPEALASQWATRGQVFALDLAGLGLRYPAFQFQPESGKPWPALAKVLARLKDLFAPLDLLLWFESPNPALDQQAPSSVLHDASRAMAAADAAAEPIAFW